MSRKEHYDDEKHGGPKPGRTRISEIIGAKIDRQLSAELLEPLQPISDSPPEEPQEVDTETVDTLVDPREQAEMRRAVDHKAVATEQERLDKIQYLGVQFVFRSGDSDFIPYMHLKNIRKRYSGDDPRLEVNFFDCRVTIRGRNLDPVHDALMGYSLADLRVSPDIFGDEEPYATWIDSITIEEV